VIPSLQTLLALGRGVARLLASGAGAPDADDDPAAAELITRAAAARERGRRDEAATLYREALARRRGHVGALRGLRDLAVDAATWPDAVEVQQRLLAVAPPAERAREAEWLAALYYELGRAELARGHAADAVAHLKSGVRADRHFTPAALALGDAYEAIGDHREAVRTWERAVETAH
jgi:tetratricopeptide (TPR) repeat protein